jgi:acyl dehydratase
MSGASSGEASPGAPLDWPQVGATLACADFGPFAPEHLARYAQASGDDNPLHLDAGVAAAVGLAAPPIHGMLMMSLFEPALRRWRRDIVICRLAGRFLRPISVGSAVRVSGRVARASISPHPELLLRLMAHGPNGDLAILGEATVRPLGAAPP